MSVLWPHQSQAIELIHLAIAGGVKRICVTSPTGGGKSRIMIELILWAKSQGMNVVLYTNRRMLLDQIGKVLTGAGLEFGIRAAGKDTHLLRAIQLSSMQTEDSRVYRKKKWMLHAADLVIVDEAHVQKGDVAERVLRDHCDQGAIVLGFTATPLGIGHLYDHLIRAGVNSELRACGAHVPAHCYAPDEPDTRDLKPMASGEFSENDVRKKIMTKTIFGRVHDHWKRLNPDSRPALLFAPGVGESLWFAQEFERKGVRAAHIDGDDIYVDGQTYKSDSEARAQLIEELQAGELAIICNRFVMREGIDIPCLYHGIFATIFGALTSYLQSGGRILRSHPDLDHVIIQDHGGNWWRHGSLNVDREWNLQYTNQMVTALREDRLREKKEAEPITCPKCFAIRLSGPACLACGYEHTRRARMVVQKNGELKQCTGDIFKPRPVKQKPDTQQLWDRMYWRAKRSRNEMTFRQAEALFFVENYYYPPRTLNNMPVDNLGWFKKVAEVSGDAIRKPEQQKAM